MNPGVSRTWRQGTAANYSTVATIPVPADLAISDRSCYVVDVNVRFTQSGTCSGSGSTTSEVNNTISCPGGTGGDVAAGTFASGGNRWLSGCTPGGTVTITKTVNGEFCCGGQGHGGGVEQRAHVGGQRG